VRILFVDDEPQILVALRRTLSKERYELAFSCSAREALEELERQHYDVIVSDNRMPDTTGVQLLRQVERQFPKTMRVLMSCIAEGDDKKRAQEDGAVDWFIEKPWQSKELCDLLRAIRGARMDRR
jgi:two-component system, NtrC family, response regulator HupR/HoxA